MCIIRLLIRFPHGREIPFAYAWVFCLTLRTEDSDRDLRCPGMSSRAVLVSLRQLSQGPGLSTQDTSTPRRVFPGFPAAHSPVTRQRAIWMLVASFQQDYWQRSPASSATNTQLFPTTAFAISIGLTLSRTASVRFHFLDKLYQTDPWVSLHAYRFTSRTVRGSSGSHGPAGWACGMCVEYSWDLTNSIPPYWHGCIQCARKRQKWFPRQNLLEEKNFLSFQFPSIQYQIYLVKTK